MNQIFHRAILGLLALFISTSAVFAEEKFDQANKQFQTGDFTGAAAGYQKLIDTNGPGTSLLYNLGNSQYRLGQYGPAILSYERAKLLSPRDPDLRANLNLARKAATVFDKGSYDPRFEAVLTWLSVNEWSWLMAGAALWIGALSMIFGIARISRPPLRKLAAGSLVFASLAILAGTTALVLRRDERNRGIVLSKDAAVRLSPFEKAETLGTPGAGRIVRIGEKNGGYFYISVPETDLHGWMSDTEVAKIIPGK